MTGGGRVTDVSIRQRLDEVISGQQAHPERIAVVIGLVSEAFRVRGLTVTVVGGSALEIHAPGAYGHFRHRSRHRARDRQAIDDVFSTLGFARRARHWVRVDLFIDVVGSSMSDPVETLDLGDLQVRVICKEVALADRIIGFKWWRYTEYELVDHFAEELAPAEVADALMQIRHDADDAHPQLVRVAPADPDPSADDVASSEPWLGEAPIVAARSCSRSQTCTSLKRDGAVFVCGIASPGKQDAKRARRLRASAELAGFSPCPSLTLWAWGKCVAHGTAKAYERVRVVSPLSRRRHRTFR
jgi:hypothetical protein